MEKTLIINNLILLKNFKKENTNSNSTEHTNNTFNNK